MYWTSTCICGALLVAVAVTQMRCSKGPTPSPITRVTVKWQRDYGGTGPQNVNRQFATSQPSQVQKLATFFPEMEKRATSGESAAWIAAATLTFHHADGSEVVVFTNFSRWNTNDRRDREVSGDLRSYLLTIITPRAVRVVRNGRAVPAGRGAVR